MCHGGRVSSDPPLGKVGVNPKTRDFGLEPGSRSLKPAPGPPRCQSTGRGFWRRPGKGHVSPRLRAERDAGLWSQFLEDQIPCPGDTGDLQLGAPPQPVPARGGMGQGKAGKPKLHCRRSPVSQVTVPQFSHVPRGDNAMATQPVGEKHSETDFHED